jgi:hypothetical protein
LYSTQDKDCFDVGVQMSAEPLLVVLSALERELHQPGVRRNARRLEELLHPSFSEFGRTGLACTRAEIVARLLNERESANVHAEDFHVRVLAEGVALLTYTSAHVTAGGTLEQHALRSSVWKLGPVGWQVVFHQGTPTAA